MYLQNLTSPNLQLLYKDYVMYTFFKLHLLAIYFCDKYQGILSYDSNIMLYIYTQSFN